MKICLIAAISRNRALGYQNNLIYHIREDLRRFRRLTERHTVIMGRKTFESLPNGALPLRHNIVISRTLPEAELNDWTSDDTTLDVCTSLEEALDVCRKRNEREVFIIGGASIYKEAMNKGIVDRFYMTEVEDVPIHADVFFPDIPFEYDVTFASVHTGENNLIYS